MGELRPADSLSRPTLGRIALLEGSTKVQPMMDHQAAAELTTG
jgi:hypothetical protein